MARLQSKVKLGHYPTPPPVASLVARYLKAVYEDACFRVLDPCVGDGTAIKIIVDTMRTQHERENGRWCEFKVETYGIEPQVMLAQVAADRLNHLLQTSFFSTTLSNGESTDRGWQFIYLNSDYDEDTEQTNTTGRKNRLEFTFLQRATLKLCPGGILVWVIPQYILRRPGVAKFLAEHYDQMHCVRFPDEMWRPPESREEVSMYGQFKQVVLFLQKRDQVVPTEPDLMARIEEWGNQGDRLSIIGTEEDKPQYEIPNAPYSQLRYFLNGAFDPDEAARQVGTFKASTKRPELGAWASDDYWTARFPNPRKVGLAVGHPMHKFKKGYLVVFAVAGLVNRAVLIGQNGRRILVKGVTRKTTHYNKTEDDVEIIEKVTDKFESSLWCTDLDSGDLIEVRTGGETTVEWGVSYETMSMADFLDNFGSSLMQQVMKLNTPRYEHPSQVPWGNLALDRLMRQPLGKQYETILAQVHGFVNQGMKYTKLPRQERISVLSQDGGIDDLLMRIAEVAEMASGKTYMAIATAFLSDLYACGCTDLATKATRRFPFFPAVVLSPPIMAKKWKREIEQTIPGARVIIVDRFGTSQSTDDDDDEQEEQQSLGSDAAADFRAFDPDFSGQSLGTVGSVDRIVARITYELSEWHRAYRDTLEENKKASEEGRALKPLPLKPCHVVVLTFTTAKMTPEWCAQYSLKPMRFIDKASGMVKMLRRADKQPVMVPSCPNCSHAILDERKVKKQLKNSPEYSERLADLEQQRSQRRLVGGRTGSRLNGYEKRIEDYLSSLDEYRALMGKLEVLRGGSAPYDSRYVALDSRIAALLERLRITDAEYRARETEEDPQEVLQYLLFHSDEYRQLIIAQDQLFTDLQWACEQRVQEYLRHLAETDENYQRLLEEKDAERRAVLHASHQLATYEEEVVHPLYLYMEETDLMGTKDHRVKRSCPHCGSPLWQYVAKRQKNWQPFSVLNFRPSVKVVVSHGKANGVHIVGSTHVAPLPLPDRGVSYPCVSNTYKRRYPVADYILDRYKGFFKLLIADEVHEGADGTALDFARQSLAKACGRMLGLTGTLSNGYASSLFRLYYLIVKQIRQDYQYGDTGRWIDDNGKRQMVQKSRKEEEEAGTGSDSKRKIKPGMPVLKEIAGVSPACMGRVATSSTFTELRDVVPGLVKYREVVRVVKMGNPLGPEYAAFEEESTTNLGKMLSTGDKSGLSPWFYALLYYPNMPWLGWECRTKQGLLFGKAPALPEDMVYPLERMLIDYVKAQQDQGLPVLVFTENTGIYDVQPRLKKLLETKVRDSFGRKPKVVILRSNSTKKTMNREEWLNRQVQAGVDVLICNPRLVKVGLDLIAFPRIAYMSFPRSTSDLRQSARRSLRPGQKVDVEVVFFAYEGSMALRVLHLMARKTQASLMVEGNVASDGLVSLGQSDELEEGDIIGQMAREMVQALSEGEVIDPEKEAQELQELFRAAAELEQKQNQLVGDESALPPVQMETIRRLPLATSASFEAASDTTVPENAPMSEATGDETVTVIPISVTDDPWAEPIVASAAMDAWAALRQQYGRKPARRGKRK
jgi:hypothetical protein